MRPQPSWCPPCPPTCGGGACGHTFLSSLQAVSCWVVMAGARGGEAAPAGGRVAERPATAWPGLSRVPLHSHVAPHLRALGGKLPRNLAFLASWNLARPCGPWLCSLPQPVGPPPLARGPGLGRPRSCFPGRKLMRATEQEAPYLCPQTATGPL